MTPTRRDTIYSKSTVATLTDGKTYLTNTTSKDMSHSFFVPSPQFNSARSIVSRVGIENFEQLLLLYAVGAKSWPAGNLETIPTKVSGRFGQIVWTNNKGRPFVVD